MVASDSATEAELVRSLLEDDFSNITVSVDADKASEDFQRSSPDVLLLAFKDLQRSEDYYLALYRLGGESPPKRHRAVILCTKEDVRQAFALCRRALFDDYVLFWPVNHDVTRLLMAVYHALGALATAPPGAPPDDDAKPAAALAAAPAAPALANLTQQSPQQPVPQASNAVRTILVVDDDDFQHKLIARLLESEPYQLEFASSGSEALNILARLRPDAILMDLAMPDMNGLEVTRHLKADPKTGSIPVIMITGNSERQTVLNGVQAGVSDYIVKPFDRSALIAKLIRVLGA
jgi:CheY-like chemotaxis protein